MSRGSQPTTYAGVRFATRPHARWAAFFSISGWAWDYRPFDVGVWAPDFAVLIPGFERPLAVLAAPALSYADLSHHTARPVASRYRGLVAVLGVGPFRHALGIFARLPKVNWHGFLPPGDHMPRWQKTANLATCRAPDDVERPSPAAILMVPWADRARGVRSQKQDEGHAEPWARLVSTIAESDTVSAGLLLGADRAEIVDGRAIAIYRIHSVRGALFLNRDIRERAVGAARDAGLDLSIVFDDTPMEQR